MHGSEDSQRRRQASKIKFKTLCTSRRSFWVILGPNVEDPLKEAQAHPCKEAQKKSRRSQGASAPSTSATLVTLPFVPSRPYFYRSLPLPYLARGLNGKARARGNLALAWRYWSISWACAFGRPHTWSPLGFRRPYISCIRFCREKVSCVSCMCVFVCNCVLRWCVCSHPLPSMEE